MNRIIGIICFLLIFLVPISSKLCGLEIKYCYIKDIAKHEFNQKLLKDILEGEFASNVSSRSAADQAYYLSSRITQVAKALIQKGFLAEAYAVPDLDQHSIVSFNCFTLWEGDRSPMGSVPLTFFVYVWPSEELALKYGPSGSVNCSYGSTIHSHPIPCAFAVLQGALVQNNYERISSNSIRLLGEEIFQEGDGDIDVLKSLFIHKLYNKGTHSKVSLSLHAYGLSSAEKVLTCFRDTLPKCSYDHYQLLKK